MFHFCIQNFNKVVDITDLRPDFHIIGTAHPAVVHREGTPVHVAVAILPPRGNHDGVVALDMDFGIGCLYDFQQDVLLLCDVGAGLQLDIDVLFPGLDGACQLLLQPVEVGLVADHDGGATGVNCCRHEAEKEQDDETVNASCVYVFGISFFQAHLYIPRNLKHRQDL